MERERGEELGALTDNTEIIRKKEGKTEKKISHVDQWEFRAIDQEFPYNSTPCFLDG